MLSLAVTFTLDRIFSPHVLTIALCCLDWRVSGELVRVTTARVPDAARGLTSHGARRDGGEQRRAEETARDV